MPQKTTFKLDNNVDAVIKKLGKEAEERVEKAAHHMRNETEKTLSGERSGETYKVPGTKDTYYTASAPGEPPAQRTGALRSSIKYEVLRKRGVFGHGGIYSIIGRVGTDLEYGKKLEYGQYPSGPNSQVARPWLRPTFKKEKDAIKAILGGSRWRI